MRKQTQKHQAGKSRSVALESLESRRHLSVAKFPLFEVDAGGPGIAYFTRGWWSAPDMCNTAGTIDASQAKITMLATIAKNGGTAPWTKKPVSANSLTFLDFEVDSLRDPLYYKKRLAWFHQTAPNAKVGIVGINFGLKGFNRDDVIGAMNGTSLTKLAMMKAQLEAQRPMIESMNVIPVDSYMLGPSSVDRDLAYIKAYASLLHQVFPTKGLVAWAWGAYHTAWNPDNAVFSDSVTQRYVQTITSSCDSMVVWGPHADNIKLEKMAPQLTGYAPAPAPAPAPTPSPSAKPESSFGFFSAAPIPPKHPNMSPLA